MKQSRETFFRRCVSGGLRAACPADKKRRTDFRLFRQNSLLQSVFRSAERSSVMLICRYLNGRPLHGEMPPLTLPFSLPRQHLPLSALPSSAILKPEDGSPGKGKS